MNSKEKTIIDVRSAAEFASGNALDSINIPLEDIDTRSEEIKQMSAPIILCCATGNRSGMAQAILRQKGIETYNGGSWYDAENSIIK